MIMNFDDQNDDNLDNGGGDFDNLDDIFRIGKDNDRDGSNDKSEDTLKKKWLTIKRLVNILLPPN